jgi:hypothetical protein
MAAVLVVLWLSYHVRADRIEMNVSHQFTQVPIDPNGQITRDGLNLALTLSTRILTRLWLFYDTDDGTPTHCPICRNELDTDVKWGTGTCANCRVQI